MSVLYNGEHEICFWKKTLIDLKYDIDDPMFTWEDFHLIPVSRPSVSVPKANYTMATVPNTSKRLNITDNLLGGLTLDSRVGEWQFYIDHEQWKDWVTTHHDLEEYFNGSKMLISLDDKTETIYEGRVSLSAYEANKDYSSVTISYDLDAEPITDYNDIYYRIRFKSSAGAVLQEDRLKYNDVPTFRKGGSYRWSPAVNRVTTNVDYIAVNR